MSKTLWFVGQIRTGELFEVQEIFSTESKANEACRNRNYFVMPLELDKNAPDETVINKRTSYHPCNQCPVVSLVRQVGLDKIRK